MEAMLVERALLAGHARENRHPGRSEHASRARQRLPFNDCPSTEVNRPAASITAPSPQEPTNVQAGRLRPSKTMSARYARQARSHGQGPAGHRPRRRREGIEDCPGCLPDLLAGGLHHFGRVLVLHRARPPRDVRDRVSGVSIPWAAPTINATDSASTSLILR